MSSALRTSAPMSPLVPGLIFLALTVVTIAVYWPGLSGPFMFDDFPNLSPMGHYGSVSDWETFRAFVFDGFAGPTGRPVSLATFLIDDNVWPTDAWDFKRTNVLLHACNGLLLFWLLVRLLRLYLPTDTAHRAEWMALLAAGLWLIHPLHVSTTLYVVQRMTQLATLFVFVGLLGYVIGRGMVAYRRYTALGVMTASIAFGTLAATLSKENGALLPMLALTIELTLFARQSRDRLLGLWRVIVLGIPSIAILGYLAWVGWKAAVSGMGSRAFDLGERVLTQARVLVEYLQHLFLPTPVTRGLYGDAFPLSTSLTQPLSTLFAVAGILGLLLVAIVVRRRVPVLSVAILFFFAGHLLESTVIPLEIYFEHRNYLSSALIFLPLAALVAWAFTHMPRVIPVAMAATCVLIVAITAARADRWGDADDLYLSWAIENPSSARAHVSAVQVLLRQERYTEALGLLESSRTRLAESLSLHLLEIIVLERLGLLDPQHLDRVGEALAQRQLNGDSLQGLRRLGEYAAQARSEQVTPQRMLTLLERVKANPWYATVSPARRLVPHLEGLQWLALGDGQAARAGFEQALARGGRVDMAMQQVALLAWAGHFDEGLVHLASAERLLRATADRDLKRPREVYAAEIARIRGHLQTDLSAQPEPSE